MKEYKPLVKQKLALLNADELIHFPVLLGKKESTLPYIERVFYSLMVWKRKFGTLAKANQIGDACGISRNAKTIADELGRKGYIGMYDNEKLDPNPPDNEADFWPKRFQKEDWWDNYRTDDFFARNEGGGLSFNQSCIWSKLLSLAEIDEQWGAVVVLDTNWSYLETVLGIARQTVAANIEDMTEKKLLHVIPHSNRQGSRVILMPLPDGQQMFRQKGMKSAGGANEDEYQKIMSKLFTKSSVSTASMSDELDSDFDWRPSDEY